MLALWPLSRTVVLCLLAETGVWAGQAPLIWKYAQYNRGLRQKVNSRGVTADGAFELVVGDGDMFVL